MTARRLATIVVYAAMAAACSNADPRTQAFAKLPTGEASGLRRRERRFTITPPTN